MFGAIASFITGIFKPAADLIDDIHVSDEERGKLKNEMARIQSDMLDKLTDLEQTRLETAASVEIAESKSSNWLKGSWRPLCSLALVGLIIAASFDPSIKLSEDIYKLTETFLGMYAGGRTVEKMVSKIKG